MSHAVVATYNIRHGRGLDGRVDLERTAAAMRRTGADLFALQEIDRFNERSGGVDQPAELERLTGMEVAFVPTVSDGSWEYGIALAARPSELAEVNAVPLPGAVGQEPRKAVLARWRGLSVLATHLAVAPDLNHSQQVALAELAATLDPPSLLLGDLNARRGRLEPLARAGFRASRPSGGTLQPWWRFKRIDHVLAGPGVGLLKARAWPGSASDHRPVTVHVRWAVEEVASVTYDA